MRIKCSTIADFLQNLDSYPIFNKVVYADRTRRRIDPRGFSYEVIYQASAVLELGEGEGQALLQVGTLCGVDRETEDGGIEGTAQQTKYHDELIRFCEVRELKLLPGMIDM